MPTTTNYGWTTPADTDLVKDGASAIRTLGSSVDTSVKALNPGTTSGDIDYYTSATAKARLAKGTDGQVLTLASGLPSWASASNAANFTLVNAGGTAMSGSATVTVSGISGKNSLFIFIDNASSVNTGVNVSLRINADSTATNYVWAGTYQKAGSTYSSGNFIGSSSYFTGASSYQLLRQSDTATNEFFAGITILGANASGYKIISANGGAGGTGVTQEGYNTQGFYKGSSTVSSISIISSSGNFDAGTLYVYASA